MLLFFLSLSFQLITQHVVVVVNLPSQAGTYCGQLYTNVYTHSHQNRHVPDIKSGINTFTKARAERHVGAANTESKTSTEFPFTILSREIIARVRDMFDMPANQQIQPDVDTDDEEEIAQSQDYPGLCQSKGRETMKFCDLCDYTTRNPTEMEHHLEIHPECCFCQKKVKNE